jgi:hypothetical protein
MRKALRQQFPKIDNLAARNHSKKIWQAWLLCSSEHLDNLG